MMRRITDSRTWRIAPPKEAELTDSRFWIVARREPNAKPLPFGWCNALSVAVAIARVLERVGLATVRVVDRRAPPLTPVVVWPPPGMKEAA